MTSRVAVALMAVVAGFGQTSQADRPIIPVIGTVQSIGVEVIYVDSGGSIISVWTDRRTEVWKGKTSHDLTQVQVGDDIAARCKADDSGRLFAELIELNVVNFFGVITAVEGDRFEMLTNPNADPQSGYEKKKLKVLVDADTMFTASAKADIQKGREVQMVGVDLRNGMVRATRLSVSGNVR